MTQIKCVFPQENHLLVVLLDNGNSVTLDFSSKLQTVRFGLLADEAFFRRAVTDGTVISWAKKVELSVSELFARIKK